MTETSQHPYSFAATVVLGNLIGLLRMRGVLLEGEIELLFQNSAARVNEMDHSLRSEAAQAVLAIRNLAQDFPSSSNDR